MGFVRNLAALHFQPDKSVVGHADQRIALRQRTEQIVEMLVGVDQDLIRIVDRDGHAQAVQRLDNGR